MSFASDYSADQSNRQAVAWADEWERTVFIRRTYTHLAAAVTAFVVIETLIFSLVSDAAMANMLQWVGSGPYNWLIVLGAFIGVSWIANSWAMSATSLPKQYAGLTLYVLAEAIIFVPLLYIATRFPGAIPAAGIMTGIVFAGLTLMVFTTRADFSWLGRYLYLAGFGAIGLILCAVIFQFQLGAIFAGAMVILASGYILYSTSNILHHYRTEQYVAASLALFASVALLFYYILRLVIAFGGRD